MKKNYLLTMLCVAFTSAISFAQLGTTTFNTATDGGGSYTTGTWLDGSNFGTGFGTWTLTKSATNSGRYIGGTGQGADSFGLFSENSGNFSSAERSLSSDLKMGETISVNLGHTPTINGEVFLQLLDDGVVVFTLKFVGGTSEWQINDGGNDFGIGQSYAADTNLPFTFSYNDDGTYSYTFGTGSGDNFNAANTISGINSIKFQSTNQGSGQNFGFNNLSIDSKYTITGNSTVASDADITIPYLTVESGSTVNIGPTTSCGVSVSGNLDNSGELNIASGSSLIINGTSTGTVTYNRNIPTTNWYLVSAPVEGQTIVDFYTDESPALGSGTGNTQNVAIAPYDNAQTLGADRWNYYTEGQVDGEDGDDTSDTFATGTGYAIKMQASGDVAFTGTLRTNDVGVSLSDGSGSGGNAFNFIGNPYTSYISVSELIEEDNVATGNEALLLQQTIWLWDESANTGAGGYVPKNLAADLEIAPGQGFFVLTGSAGTFDITEAMQSHSADTFLTPNSNRPEINLTLTNESETRAADIYYIDGTTTGFDNGYDSSIFGGFENEFAIYTHEVTTDSGRNLGIQSLPDNDYENMIIPVGINATSGMTISISASSVNLPVGIKLYLQDTSDNSFTLLENDSKFTTTLTSDLNGSGRFYLYTALDTLGIDGATLNDMIGIYTPTPEQLRIVGVQSGAASVVLYNTLGKQVLKTAFQGQGANNIALPTLASGVYVIKLTTESGIINRKIILN